MAMTDQELLKRFAGGEKGAFAEVVQRHLGLVHAAARRQTPGDADDVTQAVFFLLAQRAGKVGGHVSVAGWLLKATRYCCMNTRRMEQRRSFHEREAAAMRQQQKESTMEISGELDAALEKLSADYREPVVLRYMEGRSIVETAEMLGVSEAAAAKRAGRGLEKMREIFRAKGHEIGGDTIAGVMLLEAGKLPPAHVMSGVLAGVGKGAAAGKAGVLAQATGKALLAAKVKVIAAMMMIVAGVGAVGVVGRQQILRGTEKLPEAATEFTIPSAPGSGLGIPPADGAVAADASMAIAQYCVMVDADTATRLTDATRVVGKPSPAFTVSDGSADEVRRILNMAVTTPAANRTSVADDMLDLFAVRKQVDGWSMNWDRSMSVSLMHGGARYGVNFFAEGEQAFRAREKDGGVELAIKMNGRKMTFDEDQGNGQATVELTIKLDWSGTIAPGRAMVMQCPTVPVGRGSFAVVIVSEAFRMRGQEATLMNHLLEAGKWLALGPEGARALADRAWVWSHGSNASEADISAAKEKWSRKLSDGTVVRLAGVSRPAKWTFCWWDGDGHALGNDWCGNSRDFNDAGLGAAVVWDYSTDAAKKFQEKQEWDYLSRAAGTTYPLEEGLNSLEVYTGVGEWKEREVKGGEELELAGSPAVMRIKRAGAMSFWGQLVGYVPPEVQVRLTAVMKDGTRLEAQGEPVDDVVAITRIVPEGEKVERWFMGDSKQVDHFILRTRVREKVSFEGFAEMPLMTPPETVSSGQVDAVAAADAKKVVNGPFVEAQKQLEALENIPRDAGKPEGAMRLLVDAARKDDVGEAAKYLTGDAELVKSVARAMVAMEQVEVMSGKKFGQRAVWDAFQKRALDVTVEDAMLNVVWKIDGDVATEVDGEEKMRKVDGRWKWDVGTIFPKTQVKVLEGQMEGMAKKLEALNADLGAGKVKNADAMAQRVQEAMGVQ